MLKTLVDGLSFGEAPRWHNHRLYYADFYRHVVEAVDIAGEVEVVAEVSTQPSGLGWLPDGRMLIVSMLDKKILRQEIDGSLAEHADLGQVASYYCNDMVVDARGNAYVGNFGSDIEHGELPPKLANLAMVRANGDVSIVAENMAFPNGSVITSDAKTLIVAETFAGRLTAFDIDKEGGLSNRREWANLGDHVPDGICLDADGGIWIADPVKGGVHRFVEGGQLTQSIVTEQPAFACMLGGEDGKQLFVCTAATSGAEAAATRTGKISYAAVTSPGIGWP